MASLQAYLNKNYLSEGDKKKKKRKRTKDETSAGGLAIVDEDEAGWTQAQSTTKKKRDKNGPVVENVRSAEFRPAKNAWEVIREGENQQQEDGQDGQDEQPVIVESTTTPTVRSGLRTGAEVKADIEASKKAERARLEALDPLQSGQGAETIYRDESGQKIDVVAQRNEMKRRRQVAMEEEQKKMEWGKGLVQRDEAEKRKANLEAEASRPLARYKEDVDLNNELKERDRWNDPAAQFLTKKKSKEGRKKTTKPMYRGPAPPPNRYGIPPGYRWDGVDRSNGFERDYFSRKNLQSARMTEAHMWSTEDM